jgi:hypothetical protein
MKTPPLQRLDQRLVQRLFRRPNADSVMGYRIQEPRPTWLAACWVVLYLMLPVLLLGMLLDLLVQAVTGYCSGFWCYF